MDYLSKIFNKEMVTADDPMGALFRKRNEDNAKYAVIAHDQYMSATKQVQRLHNAFYEDKPECLDDVIVISDKLPVFLDDDVTVRFYYKLDEYDPELMVLVYAEIEKEEG